MRITESPDVDRVKPEEMPKFISRFLTQVTEAFNNKLSLSDSFDGKFLKDTFTTANVEVASIHGLGRVPIGYIVVGSTAATQVYDGASANTAQLLYLRASAASTVKVLVY